MGSQPRELNLVVVRLSLTVPRPEIGGLVPLTAGALEEIQERLAGD